MFWWLVSGGREMGMQGPHVGRPGEQLGWHGCHAAEATKVTSICSWNLSEKGSSLGKPSSPGPAASSASQLGVQGHQNERPARLWDSSGSRHTAVCSLLGAQASKPAPQPSTDNTRGAVGTAKHPKSLEPDLQPPLPAPERGITWEMQKPEK